MNLLAVAHIGSHAGSPTTATWVAAIAAVLALIVRQYRRMNPLSFLCSDDNWCAKRRVGQSHRSHQG
jgi:hypothetical protein